jgi:fatty-acyl-CoA synthase
MDTEVRITAPDGTPLPPREIGEVRVKGRGVFAGYYNDPDATAEGIVDGWLGTGDLGFLHEEELYLTGRVKDVLIIRGNNVMPHELEWLAEEVAGGGGSMRCGAFSVPRGAEGEQAVLVAETAEKDERTLSEMGREIRRRVGAVMALPLADVVFVRRGQIAKTTSGKVQRRELRGRYLAGELKRLN